MKKLKKLTRYQKLYLSKLRLNPEEYLLERQDAESYIFYHVPSQTLLDPMRR